MLLALLCPKHRSICASRYPALDNLQNISLERTMSYAQDTWMLFIDNRNLLKSAGRPLFLARKRNREVNLFGEKVPRVVMEGDGDGTHDDETNLYTLGHTCQPPKLFVLTKISNASSSSKIKSNHRPLMNMMMLESSFRGSSSWISSAIKLMCAKRDTDIFLQLPQSDLGKPTPYSYSQLTQPEGAIVIREG